jgi:EAL domain-containing protein (putative c-di-GMP-specific phosphodiesterase class I)/AmiR/NasT family two-component response regulator
MAVTWQVTNDPLTRMAMRSSASWWRKVAGTGGARHAIPLHDARIWPRARHPTRLLRRSDEEIATTSRSKQLVLMRRQPSNLSCTRVPNFTARTFLIPAQIFLMTEEDRVRVLIAEDDAAVREVLAAMIGVEPSFNLIGAACDADEAIALAAAHQPDVALIDVRMPGGGGPAAARGIRRCSHAKVIALSGQDDRASVNDMLAAGAVGYLIKGLSVDELIEAIKGAPHGRSSLSREVTGGVIDDLVSQLTARARARAKTHTARTRIQRVLRSSDRMTMVYQPIVALKDARRVGVEALARFVGPPTRTPDRWFAEAETVGLRLELEMAAISAALDHLPDLQVGLYLTVNVSPATLTSPNFLKLLQTTDPTRIIAEITEHTSIENYGEMAVALANLRGLGMRLAVDDAGAGYASLRHILHLNPDLIKLDVALVRGIESDTAKRALATGLVSFAARSASVIVAEGIESQAEAETLAELGAEYGQGYYFGRPASLTALQPQVAPIERVGGSRPATRPTLRNVDLAPSVGRADLGC